MCGPLLENILLAFSLLRLHVPTIIQPFLAHFNLRIYLQLHLHWAKKRGWYIYPRPILFLLQFLPRRLVREFTPTFRLVELDLQRWWWKHLEPT